MDLQVLGRVLWRFRFLVAVGVAFAIGLAFLSYLRVEFADGRPTVTYREKEQWESLSKLFITPKGFSWGSVLGPDIEPGASLPGTSENAEGGTSAPQEVDPAYLIWLASVYLELATSDAVLNRMQEEKPIDGAVKAFAVYAGGDARGELLPMVTLSAISDTPASALDLARRHQKAFRDYIALRQKGGDVAPEERVVVEVVRQPQPPELLAPRKKTRAIIVFLAVMVAVVGLAFVLENIRPRVHPVEATANEPPLARRMTRRSASA
jgi:hypothetical protein